MSKPFSGHCPQGKKCWPTDQIDYSCENDCRPFWRENGKLMNRADLRRVFGRAKRREQKERAKSVMAMVGRMRTDAEAKRQQEEMARPSPSPGLVVPASTRRVAAR